MVALGWSEPGKSEDTAEIIDLVDREESCTRFPDFPHRMTDSAAGLLPNGTPIICGSRTPHFGDGCRIFRDGKWTPYSKMTVASSNFAMVTMPGGDLLLTGGATKNPECKPSVLNRTDLLTADGKWRNTHIDLPIAVAYHCMVLINKSIPMVIGGQPEPFKSTRKTFILSVTENIWKKGPELLSPRRFHFCSSININNCSAAETIIVAGGKNDSYEMALSTVEILEHGWTGWRLGPELPHPLYGATMVRHPNGGVVIIGGNSLKRYSDVLYYLPNAGPGEKWQKLQQTLTHARDFHVSVLVPDDITENCYEE